MKMDELFELHNPDVSYVGINLRTLDTKEHITFKKNITQYIKENKDVNGHIKYGYGDGTVNSDSLFLAPLKWAYEFIKKKKGAKPIKFVDFCSNYNEKYSIFDNY